MRYFNRTFLFFLTLFLAMSVLSFAVPPSTSATDAIIIEQGDFGSLSTETQTIWVEQAYLKASNPDENDGFDSSVAISGDTLGSAGTVQAQPGDDLLCATQKISASSTGNIVGFTSDSSAVIYEYLEQFYRAALDGSGASTFTPALTEPAELGYYFLLSPDATRLIYRVNTDGVGPDDVTYIVPVDGSSAPVVLSNRSLGRVRFSLDSAYVLWNEGGVLFRQNSDGSGSPQQLSTGGTVRGFRLTPDGLSVIYVTQDYGNGSPVTMQIHRVPLAGGSADILFSVSEVMSRYRIPIILTPDGSKLIIVYTDRDGISYTNAINLRDGGPPVTLHSFVEMDFGIYDLHGISPDGKYLIYTLYDSGIDVYSVPVDGSNDPAKLSEGLDLDGPHIYEASILPDSSAVLMWDIQFFGSKQASLAVSPIDGTDAPKQISLESDTLEVGWRFWDVAPDASQVVYRLGGTLYSVPATGGTSVQIGIAEIAGAYPFITPDSSWVIYQMLQPDNVATLHASPIEGGPIINIMVDFPGSGVALRHESLQFSPDGTYMVYTANFDDTSWDRHLYSTRCEAPGPRPVYAATNLAYSGDTSTTPSEFMFSWTHNTADATVDNVSAREYQLTVSDGANTLHDETYAVNAVCTDATCTATITLDFISEGEHTYTITGLNPNDISTSASSTFDVDLPTAPTLTNPGDQTSTEGDTISLQLTASDPDVGDTLTWAESGLPPTLSIDQNGLISGTAATAGEYTVTITVTDSTQLSDDATFTWTINEPGALVGDPGRVYPAHEQVIESASDWPRFTFEPHDGAEWYGLWIGTVTPSVTTAIYQWFPATATSTGITTETPICDTTTMVCTLPVDVWLADGQYSWWMTYWGPTLPAWNSYWNGTNFSVDFAAPTAGALTGVTPSGTVNTAPTQVTWDRDPNVMWMQIWLGQVVGPDGVPFTAFYDWVDATDICDATTCTLALDASVLPIPDGDYEMWMQQWGPGGFLGWTDVNGNSPAATFSVETTP